MERLKTLLPLLILLLHGLILSEASLNDIGVEMLEEDGDEMNSKEDCLPSGTMCERQCRQNADKKFGKSDSSAAKRLDIAKCLESDCKQQSTPVPVPISTPKPFVKSCEEQCQDKCQVISSDDDSSEDLLGFDPNLEENDFDFDFENDALESTKEDCRTECLKKCSTPNTPPTSTCTYKPSTSRCTSRLTLSNFKSMWENYPTMGSSEFKKMVGGKVNADWIKHTCAVRMSYAINKSDFAQKPQSLDGVLNTVKGGDGFEYAYRVKELLAYLKKKEFTSGFTRVWINPAQNAKHLSGYVPDSLKCERGIIYFKLGKYCGDGGKESSASNHIDLFDGEKCAGACYFKCSNEVSMISICDENTSCCR